MPMETIKLEINFQRRNEILINRLLIKILTIKNFTISNNETFLNIYYL